MNDIERADRFGTIRALLLLVLAAYIWFDLWLTASLFERPVFVAGWVAMMAVIALNLTGIGGRLKNKTLRRLMNDESVRAHRRIAVTTGFWTAMLGCMAAMVALAAQLLPAIVVVAAILSAALSAALLHFAFLELRAAR